MKPKLYLSEKQQIESMKDTLAAIVSRHEKNFDGITEDDELDLEDLQERVGAILDDLTWLVDYSETVRMH